MQESAKRLLDAARDSRSAVVCQEFNALQAALKVSPAVMTNWKARGVSEGGALKAEATLGCSAHWVLTGQGEMFPGRSLPKPSTAFAIPAPPAPLTPEAGVSVNIRILDAYPASKMVAWEELCMPDLPNVFKLTLQDDSLAPKHQRGDFVELQRDLAPAAGDWVLVRIAHDEHTICSFIDLGTEGWAAAPINKPGEAITSKSGAAVVAVYIGGGVSGRMSSR